MRPGTVSTRRPAFSFGATRSAEQDPQFLIDELVEIGLRALSPAINDPFTAINALHWLGAATAELGRRDLRRRYEDHPEHARVHPLPDTFAHFLHRGFGSLRSAAATSPVAALVMFDTLRTTAAPMADPARIVMLRDEGTRLYEQARFAIDGPDMRDVENQYREFLRAFPG